MSKVEMSEKLSQKDISGSEKEKQEPGLELVKGEELDNVVEVANNLAGKLERDEDITAGEIVKLDEALKNMKVDFYGDEMTVDEIKEIPDLEENIKMWDEIKRGEKYNVPNLTYITKSIAEILMQNTDERDDSVLSFIKLKRLPDDAAKVIFSKSGKRPLFFHNLELLSDRAVEEFCKSDAHIFGMSNCTKLSDNAIRILTESKKNKNNFQCSSDVQKRIDEYRAKNKK